MEKLYIEADIKLEETTEELQKAFASVIELPKTEDKQPDLQYFSAIFVSAGCNLNNAYFLPSELVKAEDTIVSKALDVEHTEDEIIGHMYDRAFIDGEHKKLSLNELANKEAASLNTENKDMHVVIAGVVYKNRFPNVSKEIAEGKWKVSMECYYSNYDVKVGNIIMTRRDAEAVGLANTDKLFGRMAKVIKKGKEIASGKLERVLRGITFSGCGIVKNPANPPSVVLETANVLETDDSSNNECKEVVVIDYDLLDPANKLTSSKIDADDSVITDPSASHVNDTETSDKESALQSNDIGICVNYKRRLDTGKEDSVKEDWCTAYDTGCTSFSRDTTDPDCLRNSVKKVATAHVKNLMEKTNKNDRQAELTNKLKDILDKVGKLN